MKYMGSKRAMLRNGLGALLEQEVPTATRFVDLFTGSAAVASHVAQNFDVPVLAADLQTYSVALANAVIRRQRPIDWWTTWEEWQQRGCAYLSQVGNVPRVSKYFTKDTVSKCRQWCSRQTDLPITSAYGGHC
jgi:adenine-specific DNA-methyltransferase